MVPLDLILEVKMHQITNLVLTLACFASLEGLAYDRCELTLRQWNGDSISFWSTLRCDGTEVYSENIDSDNVRELLSKEGEKVLGLGQVILESCEFRKLPNARDFVCQYSRNIQTAKDFCVLAVRQWKGDNTQVIGTLHCNAEEIFNRKVSGNLSSETIQEFISEVISLGYQQLNCQSVEHLNARDRLCFFTR